MGTARRIERREQSASLKTNASVIKEKTEHNYTQSKLVSPTVNLGTAQTLKIVSSGIHVNLASCGRGKDNAPMETNAISAIQWNK